MALLLLLALVRLLLQYRRHRSLFPAMGRQKTLPTVVQRPDDVHWLILPSCSFTIYIFLVCMYERLIKRVVASRLQLSIVVPLYLCRSARKAAGHALRIIHASTLNSPLLSQLGLDFPDARRGRQWAPS